MKRFSAIVCVVLGCPSNPAPVGSVASAPVSATAAPVEASVATDSVDAAPSAPVAATPKWLEAAARAPAVYANAAQSEYTHASSFRHDEQINPVLDRVAAQEPSAAGLRAAAKILVDNAGAGTDMNWTGSGSSPAGRLLHAAGFALLYDLVTRACAAHPNDATMGPTLDALNLPRLGATGDEQLREDDRDALRVAASACGVKSKRPKPH